MGLYYNAKGIGAGGTSNTVELISHLTDATISSVNIANTHASNAGTVTLFMQNSPSSGSTETYKLFEGVSIPSKTSLLLDNKHILKRSFGFGLYLEIGNADTLDIIMS